MRISKSISLPDENQNYSNSFIPVLTGLRAVAAFLVFFSHYPIPAKRLGVFFAKFCSELYIGVSIFFILSGFLITLRYSDKFTYSAEAFLVYMKKRFARIYPMYFILTSLTFIFYTIYPSFDIPSFIATPAAGPLTVYLLNISFLRGFFDDVALSGISQGWTLTVEECFYILAPFIFLIRKRIPLVIQLVCFYITGFALVYLFVGADLLGFFKDQKFMLIVTIFGRSLEFFVGIRLALWYKNNSSLLPGGRYTYLGMLCVVLTVTLLVFTKDPDAEHYYGLYSSTGLFINNFVLPFAIAFVFKGLLREKTWVRSILENKYSLLLGKSSYVFYLIHMGFISELLHRYVTHNYLLNFPFLVVLSIVMYKVLEDPLNKFIVRSGKGV